MDGEVEVEQGDLLPKDAAGVIEEFVGDGVKPVEILPEDGREFAAISSGIADAAEEKLPLPRELYDYRPR